MVAARTATAHHIGAHDENATEQARRRAEAVVVAMFEGLPATHPAVVRCRALTAADPAHSARLRGYETLLSLKTGSPLSWDGLIGGLDVGLAVCLLLRMVVVKNVFVDGKCTDAVPIASPSATEWYLSMFVAFLNTPFYNFHLPDGRSYAHPLSWRYER